MTIGTAISNKISHDINSADSWSSFRMGIQRILQQKICANDCDENNPQQQKFLWYHRNGK